MSNIEGISKVTVTIKVARLLEIYEDFLINHSIDSGSESTAEALLAACDDKTSDDAIDHRENAWFFRGSAIANRSALYAIQKLLRDHGIAVEA